MNARPEQPVIRVVRGGPTEEETAALVAVLAAATAGARAQERQRSLWGSRARAVRPRLSPGPGAWRASALPR